MTREGEGKTNNAWIENIMLINNVQGLDENITVVEISNRCGKELLRQLGSPTILKKFKKFETQSMNYQ